MAIWKEPTTTNKKDANLMTPPPAPPAAPEPAVQRENNYPADIAPAPAAAAPRRATSRELLKESIIAADITITGKIDGAGHVRIAGRFEGDVHIQGDLTIDAGAKLTGSVRANTVIISGEIEGNIESAQRVELLDSGMLTGDLKAGTVTFAAGSRMRGRAEFGWGDETQSRPGLTLGTTSLAS